MNPTMLSALTLMIPRTAPLSIDVGAGRFTPLTARGFLDELEAVLQQTTMASPCIFRSNHVSNLFALAGTLPQDKSALLSELSLYKPQLDNTVPLLNDTGGF